MPKAALKNVSLKQLVAELEKRKAKLAILIKQRDAMDVQIMELQGLAGAEVPIAAPVPAPNATKAKKTAKRATGKPLAEYVHAVLAATEKGLSLKEIEAKVRAAGYPTTAKTIYNPLMKVLGKGFKKVERGVYALKAAAKAGKKAAKAVMAPKPVAKAKKSAKAAKPAAKAKTGKKRTFACPTCKQVFASGIMVGQHYKAEPTHRIK